jgi:hypothetical protein
MKMLPFSWYVNENVALCFCIGDTALHLVRNQNSGLWDMRNNDPDEYVRQAEELAALMRAHADKFPRHRMIWRATFPTHWNRLDNNDGDIENANGGRAQEMLLNADNVRLYNSIGANAMRRHQIEIFDPYFIGAGRPDLTRSTRDGLHAAPALSTEIMLVFMSVVCAGVF